MLQKNHKSLKAFTLVELLIVIAIVGVMAGSARYVNFNEMSSKARSEVFTNSVSRVIENTRNSALLGRSFLDQNPDAWRVSIDTTNSGTFITEYLSGSTWETYDDSDFTFGVDFPAYIEFIACNTSGDVSSGTGTIVFDGRDITFAGDCDANDKFMTIGTGYSSYTGEVIINSTSGVIETVK